MREQRLWRRASGLVAVGAVLLGAGCNSSSLNSSSSSSGTPSATHSPSATASAGTSTPSRAPTGGNDAAQRAAEAVQGPAAVPTSAQLAALKAERSEIAKLSPAQLAGQRVIYSYNGLSAPFALLNAIRHGLVGGVIFFTFNISSPAQIRHVIAQLIAANNSPDNPARGFPLLLMTDQEGGLVRRLPGPPYESQAQIGASANPASAAAQAGSGAAANLGSYGLNVNLAPVLDVFRQPGDFDDQVQRSYSMNPQVVASAAAAFITAQQKAGVAATAKHFPGLGAAGSTQDTDNEPVTIDLSAQILRTVDEMPYPAAFKAGVKLTMVSWANFPALDPKLPAGLSPTIIQGELQRRLGFTGVTITDALGAGALAAYGSLQNKTMLAARAGMDALLCTATKPLPGWKCVAGLKDGLEDGALPKEAFEAQLAQLLQLRASLHP